MRGVDDTTFLNLFIRNFIKELVRRHFESSAFKVEGASPEALVDTQREIEQLADEIYERVKARVEALGISSVEDLTKEKIEELAGIVMKIVFEEMRLPKEGL